jgi:hypothetical protein
MIYQQKQKIQKKKERKSIMKKTVLLTICLALFFAVFFTTNSHALVVWEVCEVGESTSIIFGDEGLPYYNRWINNLTPESKKIILEKFGIKEIKELESMTINSGEDDLFRIKAIEERIRNIKIRMSISGQS